MPPIPAIEEMETILPFPDAFKRGCASWLKWKHESKFKAIHERYSSAVISIAGLMPPPPTLFT
jgi:hypothetical protein